MFYLFKETSHKAVLYIVLCLLSASAFAEESTSPEQLAEQANVLMTNERLHTLISKIDPEYVGRLGYWQLQVFDLSASVITDEKADRMRIVIPIKEVAEIDAEEMYRLMQANFDSALDARYAVAKGVVWATFIHPLSPLNERQFISGLVQTVNIVKSYGGSYSSGALHFGGGDSGEILEKEQVEELLKKGQII